MTYRLDGDSADILRRQSKRAGVVKVVENGGGGD